MSNDTSSTENSANGTSANPLVFRCPACRARQELVDTCRRCAADLSLMARAHRHVYSLLAQREQAREEGNRQLEESLSAELLRLAPNW